MGYYVDSHTHLNSPKLFSDWQKYVEDFKKKGGVALVNTGADEEYNKNGLEITKKYKGKIFIKSTIGLHPYEVECGNINKSNLEEKIKDLEKLFLKNKEHIVAIGEAGIDISFNKEKSNLELQKELFKSQCELAKKLALPIIIHSRDDIVSTLEVLENYKDLKIYFHCWGYGPEEIQKIQKMFDNIWIGFCGNISYPKAQNIKDSLAVVNIKNILLETDAPYLPPQEYRGQTNYPAYVKYIYEFISRELNMSEIKLQNIIKENFENLYIK